MVRVEVWWGRPGQQSRWQLELLDGPERRRRAAMHRPADRARFTVATVVAKLVAGRRLGLPADRVTIDRTCPDCGRPHGRPRLPGHPLAVSIAHSGDRTLVALTGGAPVGADVEQVVPLDHDQLAGQVLAAGESAGTLPDFFCYWTRKEAVVKATGDGLRVPMIEVAVTPPGQPPRLLRYGARTDLTASLADLDAGTGYAAALAVLAPGPLLVDAADAGALLAGHH